MVVANLINESMGKSSAQVTVIDRSSKIVLPKKKKEDLTLDILEQIFKVYSKEMNNDHIY